MSSETALGTTAAETAGSVSLTPGVVATGLSETGVPATKTAADTSAKTIFGKLSSISTDNFFLGKFLICPTDAIHLKS